MQTCKILIFSLIASAFLLTILVTTQYAYPVGADVHFHIKVAEAWARGENGMFAPIVMRVNRFPYPPLFHFLIVPSVLLGQQITFLRIMQVFLWPLTIASTVFAAWKFMGKREAFLVAVSMWSSISVLDGSFQLKPQAFDMLLLPIAFYAIAKDKKMFFSAIVLWIVYSHGLVAVPLFAGLFLWLFKTRKEWRKPLLITLLLAVPMLTLQLIYYQGAIEKWAGVWDTPQERWFWRAPFFFSLYYVGTPLIGYFASIYSLKERSKFSMFYKTVLVSFASLWIMLPLWPDRFLQYVPIPLSFIAVRHIEKSKFKYAYYFAMICLFAFYASAPWLWLVNDEYYIFKGEW